jgi:Ca-activated chloride channel homolog
LANVLESTISYSRSAGVYGCGSRRQDWAAVERTLSRARVLAQDNEWMRSVVSELEGLAAQRDSVMFQKEAVYSARRVRSRLAAAREVNDLQDSEGPSFLRRKTMQGKSELPKK